MEQNFYLTSLEFSNLLAYYHYNFFIQHDISQWILPSQAAPRDESSTVYFDRIRHVKLETIQSPTQLNKGSLYRYM